MNWTDWYTDTMEIWRVAAEKDGALTTQARQQVLAAVPCRIYRNDGKAISMSQTAASSRQDDKLACDISVDVRTGDELIITRGGRLGRPGPVIRAFAGEPNLYYEPFGAIIPGLAHQEIPLMQQERV